jgi:hypothetical protein
VSAAISIENVSKAYRLGQIGGGTIKEDFAHENDSFGLRPVRKTGGNARDTETLNICHGKE